MPFHELPPTQMRKRTCILSSEFCDLNYFFWGLAVIVGTRQWGSEAGAAARKFSHVLALSRDPGYIGLWTQNILDPSLQ